MKYYSLSKKSINGEKVCTEIFKSNSSVEYWRKVIKNDEKEGSYVEAEFEYDKKLKEIVLSRYFVVSQKRDERISIYLIRNPSTLKRINKKNRGIK